MPVSAGLWRGLRPQTCSGGSLPSSLRSPRLGSVVCHSRSLRSMCRETEDGCPVRARAARPTHPPFQSQERRPVPERGAGATRAPQLRCRAGEGGTGTASRFAPRPGSRCVALPDLRRWLRGGWQGGQSRALTVLQQQRPASVRARSFVPHRLPSRAHARAGGLDAPVHQDR